VTTNQILIGVGLILALAAGSQVLASRLRIPAIIVLLPAGFIAGALTSNVNPQDLLGPAFEPLRLRRRDLHRLVPGLDHAELIAQCRNCQAETASMITAPVTSDASSTLA
jgi:hypothetical protein